MIEEVPKLYGFMVPSTNFFKQTDVASAVVRDLLRVDSGTAVRDAIARMSQKQATCRMGRSPTAGQRKPIEAGSDCVLVVHDQKLVGILTEQDILKLSLQPQPFDDLQVGEVMTRPAVTLRESELTDVYAALHLLQHHGICHLPILDEQEHPVGLLTPETLRHVARPSDWMRLQTVSNVMKSDVVTADASVSMRETIRLLVEHRVSCVILVQTSANDPATSRPMPIGIVTERDVLQFQALALDPTSPVQAIMSTPVFSVQPEDSLWCVHQMMEKHSIRRGVVTGSQGELMGIVTQTDLLHALHSLEPYPLTEALEPRVRRLETEQMALLEGRATALAQQVEDETTTLQIKANPEKLLLDLATQIRNSLDLQTIFETACDEIRQAFQSDRVGIFKFYPCSDCDEGEFVAESMVAGWPSAMAVRIRDRCFSKKHVAACIQAQGYIAEDIDRNSLNTCYSPILKEFGVRASLSYPLLCGSQLWGLLCIHQCAIPRQWQSHEITLAHKLSDQLAIAIKQAELYEQTQAELAYRQRAEATIAQQLQQQQALGRISQQIRESLNLQEILGTAVEQVKAGLGGDRVVVFRLFRDGSSQIVEEAVSPGFPCLKHRQWKDEVWSQEMLNFYWQGKPRIVPDVMEDGWLERLLDYSIEGHIQSKMVAPILLESRQGEHHRWIDPKTRHQLWGVLVIHACEEQRVWDTSEAELLQQVANQLAIAIYQSNLFEQLQQELRERQQTQQQLTIANEELLRATRLKDEFLANISHELRTPLNAILGMAEGLQEQVFGTINPRQRKSLDTIERSAFHLLSLINDILDVAKIESGKIELDLIPAAIAPLCKACLTFIKQQAQQKDIRLEMQHPFNLPQLFIDERRIRQVLVNLLNNAVKFTPQGGQVGLSVTLESPSTPDNHQHYMRFSVHDTGIGIAPEHVGKLFRPFIQIDSALNRQHPGTGLGLVLVKRIVELHGGRVHVTSEVGVGSCFSFDLPCVTPPAASARSPHPPIRPQSPSPSLEQSTAPHRILLAEDQETNISTLSSYLKAKGYQVLLARNGEEAIALAQSEHPNLILIDIQMPGVDGLEAITCMRRDPALASVPIIALTALAMEGDRERCIAGGANEYISKPVKLRHLVATIQELLSHVVQE
jgi:signal transduction histidine kinase/CBS domain-containing protein/ActR/RegA family two-component response regulator